MSFLCATISFAAIAAGLRLFKMSILEAAFFGFGMGVILYNCLELKADIDRLEASGVLKVELSSEATPAIQSEPEVPLPVISLETGN